MNMQAMLAEIMRQRRKINYNVKYITLSETHMSKDSKIRDMGLKPVYDENMNPERIYLS